LRTSRSQQNADIRRISRDQTLAGDGEVEEKSLYANFRLGAQYDNNVGAWPWDDAFVQAQNLDEDQDDWAAVANLALDWQRVSDSPWTFRAGYWLYADAHLSYDQYNLTGQALTLEPGYGQGRISCRLPVSVNFSTEDNLTDSYGWSVQPTLALELAKNHSLEAWGAASQTGYQSPDSSLAGDDQDADTLGGGGGYLFLFSGGFFRLSGDWRTVEADGDNWDRESVLGAAVARVPLGSRLALTLSGVMEDVEYDNPHSFFNEARQDTIFTTSADLTFRAAGPWEFWLLYNFTRADSNLPLYEYDRHVIGAGLGMNL